MQYSFYSRNGKKTNARSAKILPHHLRVRCNEQCISTWNDTSHSEQNEVEGEDMTNKGSIIKFVIVRSLARLLSPFDSLSLPHSTFPLLWLPSLKFLLPCAHYLIVYWCLFGCVCVHCTASPSSHDVACTNVNKYLSERNSETPSSAPHCTRHSAQHTSVRYIWAQHNDTICTQIQMAAPSISSRRKKNSSSNLKYRLTCRCIEIECIVEIECECERERERKKLIK